jgi:HSP90 family molecular chaperone
LFCLFVPGYRTQSFKDHKFEVITKDNIKFKDEDEDLVKRRGKAYKKKFDPLIKYLKKSYRSAITKVVVSSRLDKAPAMISTSQYESTSNLEHLLRAQSYQHGNDDVLNQASCVFEINPCHPFVTSLLDLVPPAYDNEEDPFKVLDSTNDSIWLLHDVALLNS